MSEKNIIDIYYENVKNETKEINSRTYSHNDEINDKNYLKNYYFHKIKTNSITKKDIYDYLLEIEKYENLDNFLFLYNDGKNIIDYLVENNRYDILTQLKELYGEDPFLMKYKKNHSIYSNLIKIDEPIRFNENITESFGLNTFFNMYMPRDIKVNTNIEFNNFYYGQTSAYLCNEISLMSRTKYFSEYVDTLKKSIDFEEFIKVHFDIILNKTLRYNIINRHNSFDYMSINSIMKIGLEHGVFRSAFSNDLVKENIDILSKLYKDKNNRMYLNITEDPKSFKNLLSQYQEIKTYKLQPNFKDIFNGNMKNIVELNGDGLYIPKNNFDGKIVEINKDNTILGNGSDINYRYIEDKYISVYSRSILDDVIPDADEYDLDIEKLENYVFNEFESFDVDL